MDETIAEATEVLDRADLEAKVRTNEGALREWLAALVELYDRKLYLETHTSWAAYALDTFGYSRSTANRSLTQGREMLALGDGSEGNGAGQRVPRAVHVPSQRSAEKAAKARRRPIATTSTEVSNEPDPSPTANLIGGDGALDRPSGPTDIGATSGVEDGPATDGDDVIDTPIDEEALRSAKLYACHGADRDSCPIVAHRSPEKAAAHYGYTPEEANNTGLVPTRKQQAQRIVEAFEDAEEGAGAEWDEGQFSFVLRAAQDQLNAWKQKHRPPAKVEPEQRRAGYVKKGDPSKAPPVATVSHLPVAGSLEREAVPMWKVGKK